jgi:hypothetical protein
VAITTLFALIFYFLSVVTRQQSARRFGLLDMAITTLFELLFFTKRSGETAKRPSFRIVGDGHHDAFRFAFSLLSRSGETAKRPSFRIVGHGHYNSSRE